MKTVSQIPFVDCTKCTACGECAYVCPQNAIERIQNQSCSRCVKYCSSYSVTCKNTHYFVCENKCDSCGKCISVCKENAISWVDREAGE